MHTPFHHLWTNHALQRTAPVGHACCSPQSPPRSHMTVTKLKCTLLALIAVTFVGCQITTPRQAARSTRGSGLDSLVLEGHELHASLKTRQLDDSDRRHHVPRALLPGNPHVSTNAAFVAAIATCASQGSLGSEGVRSALYALYLGKKELGFYGLEAESAADADRWEGSIRKVLSHNVRLGMMQVHRQGLVLVVVWRDWPDGVSPECWEAVNAKVVERLVAP